MLNPMTSERNGKLTFFPTDDAGQDGDEADGDVDGGEGDEPAHGRHEDRSLDHQNRFDRVRFGCAVF